MARTAEPEFIGPDNVTHDEENENEDESASDDEEEPDSDYQHIFWDE